MRVNSITPTFKGEGDVIIGYKDGKNAKNPYVNNIVNKLLYDLRKEHISATTHFSTKTDTITISSAPEEIIRALAKTDLVCRVQRGNSK